MVSLNHHNDPVMHKLFSQFVVWLVPFHFSGLSFNGHLLQKAFPDLTQSRSPVLLFKTPYMPVSLLAVFTISDYFVCLFSYLLNVDPLLRL